MRTLQQKLLLFALSILTSHLALAQTGPGGIGSSTDNKLWLDAADISTKTLNGSTVSQWNDRSGNANHATQSTSGNQPTNNPTGIVSRQTITFDGVNDRFDLPSASVLATNSPFSFFALIKPSNFALDRAIFSAGNGNYVSLGTNGSSKIYFYDLTSTLVSVQSVSTLSSGTPYTFHAQASSSVSQVSMYLDGTQDPAAPAAITQAAIPGGVSERTIGAGAAGSFPWSGDIGEVIMYNRALNSAERTIILSYLSKKWGTTFSGNKFGGSSSYSEGVVGIGQESDGSSWVGGADGLVLTNTVATSANGEYLMAGHDAGANSVVTSDVTGSVTHRWSRVWYLDKTGTFDLVDFRIGFDFSASGIGGTPAVASNYQLLYRAGTSGIFTPVPLTFRAIVGDVVNCDVSASDLSDGYYTIGTTNNATSPLPVQMVSFTASVQNASTTLQWKTETEVNNHGFEIERRAVNSHPISAVWQTAGFVSGSGTSSSPHSYTFVDRDPLAGRFAYRIKQIDNGGSFSYTGEVEVEVGLAPKELTLGQNFPNPFNPSTMISFSVPADGHATLKVFDVLGREVATLVNGEVKAGYVQQATFNASHLPSGVYYSTLESGGKRMTSKMQLVK